MKQHSACQSKSRRRRSVFFFESFFLVSSRRSLPALILHIEGEGESNMHNALSLKAPGFGAYLNISPAKHLLNDIITQVCSGGDHPDRLDG